MPTLSDVILEDAPKIYVKLDEASGPPTNYGSMSLTMIHDGSPSYNQNVDGYTCVKIPGGAAALRSSDSLSDLNNISEFSFEMLIKDDGGWPSAQSVLFEIGKDSAAPFLYNIRCMINTGADALNMDYTDASGTSAGFQASSVGLSTSKWNHIVMTLDSSNVIRHYLAGALVGQSSALSPALPTSGTTRDKMRIFTKAVVSPSADIFNVDVAHVAIYSTALSASRIGIHNSAAFPAPANRMVRKAMQWPRPIGHMRI